MISELYQKTILKHAANATAHGEMTDADHSLMIHNPMCGDRIKVYVKLKNGAVIDLSHEAKACALCQASASILGEHFHGLDAKSLSALIGLLKLHLGENEKDTDTIWPDEKWNDLNVFKVVRDHKSRQTCVLLPFEALMKLLNEIS